MARTKLHFLPNTITLANLLCGCLGVVWAFDQELQWAIYMIWAAAVLDFIDGSSARMLGISSQLGKQLDSLADLVSFGLLPSVVIFVLFSSFNGGVWPYFSFGIALFSALRLAKFNIDSEQSTDFKGLPTPANALLISSFPAIIGKYQVSMHAILEQPVSWILMIALLSYLLVSRIRFIGLKFRDFTWALNKYRYLFLATSLVLALVLGITAVPFVILMYFVMSLAQQYQLF